MADARQWHLNRIGVIGFIICACVAGRIQQPPALPQSSASSSIDGGRLEPTAMVGASPPGVAVPPQAMDQRPARPLFGMETEPVLGPLTSKWRAVELEIGHEERVLADCRAQRPCPEPARDLLNLIAQAAGRTGRARVGLINRAVDLAIAPVTDEAQWGVEDHWSSPFETLQTHRGDCEDYAIVKYVALRQAGLPPEDVKIVILRNQFPNEYHAVAVTRVNGEWLILDNRQLTLVRDTDVIRATPKFLLDEYGVHRFVRGILLGSLLNATGGRAGAHTDFSGALGEPGVGNKTNA
jgi:predicted transglutaminase-like cysteine proteinase